MARVKPDFSLKRGDLSPAFQIACKQGDGTPIDLTGATVLFSMRPRGGAAKIDLVACVVIGAPSAGIVEYRWQGTDTDTVGDYDAEFQITLAGGNRTTLPANDYFWVKVLDIVS